MGAGVLAALAGVAVIVRVLLFGRDVPGYASLMVVLLFCFALQMVAFGIMGEYLGRLYQETKQRPIYILREPPE
jgi:polyisoprenyl-phosphate glycosyltransferase